MSVLSLIGRYYYLRTIIITISERSPKTFNTYVIGPICPTN
ncbi:hypothetical protein HMPREF9419_2102 [Prevotella nigrescens ATCC 33563]|nr:hypothetical protein HMPREF9419_2102 [Prevotella nigrescens ATCC 33563]